MSCDDRTPIERGVASADAPRLPWGRPYRIGKSRYGSISQYIGTSPFPTAAYNDIPVELDESVRGVLGERGARPLPPPALLLRCL